MLTPHTRWLQVFEQALKSLNVGEFHVWSLAVGLQGTYEERSQVGVAALHMIIHKRSITKHDNKV